MVETEKGSYSMTIANLGVLSGLMAVLTIIIIPMPTPLGAYDPSTILIVALGILYGPAMATSITCLGQFIGTVYLTTFMGWPAVFIPGIVAVRGLEAFIIGSLRVAFPTQLTQKEGKYIPSEIIAAIAGPIWETIGFLIADLYLFGPAGLIVIFTIVDLIWVPPGLLVVYSLRKAFNAEYLDQKFGITLDHRSKRTILYPSIFVIILSWIFILLAPTIGLL